MKFSASDLYRCRYNECLSLPKTLFYSNGQLNYLIFKKCSKQNCKFHIFALYSFQFCHIFFIFVINITKNSIFLMSFFCRFCVLSENFDSFYRVFPSYSHFQNMSNKQYYLNKYKKIKAGGYYTKAFIRKTILHICKS
jgi:hypothetical protein